MWMKNDHIKDGTIGRSAEGGILRCPMCKGRGYFEPTEVNTTKSADCFPIEDDNSSIKLPRLQAKPSTKQVPKPKSKYRLPSINNVKNLPEHRSTDSIGQNEYYSGDYECKDFRDKISNIDELGSHKSELRIKTGLSQGLSIASSIDSVNEHLLPSPKTPKSPAETLKTSLSKLKSSNWGEGLNALKDIIQLSRFQPKMLDSSMVVVYRGLIHFLKSFRSVVVRTACQATNELFGTMGNTQRPEFDELVGLLLQKTADTNKVIRQDANEALDTMIINISPIHSVRTITQKGITHKSPLVRGAAARLLVCLVGIAGVENIYAGSREIRGKIISAAASFLQDGCQEVRTFGKRLMKMLMQHDEFDDILQSEVSETMFKRIEKTLVSMKYKA